MKNKKYLIKAWKTIGYYKTTITQMENVKKQQQQQQQKAKNETRKASQNDKPFFF